MNLPVTAPLRRISNRLLPDSVIGRTTLVLVAALLLTALAALAVFDAHRDEVLSSLGGRNAAERVGALVGIAEGTAPHLRHDTMRTQSTPGFRVGWGPSPIVTENEAFGLANFVREVLEKGLEGREILISTRPPPPPPPGSVGPRPGGRGHGMMGPALRISVKLNDGSWLNVLAPFDLGDTMWHPRFVLTLLLSLLLVTVLALLAVRKATRPFATFATAAERLGVDVSAPPMAESGPLEVRTAAHAFNVMQGRIARFVQDRTQMLAAISHDLKTPITRLRLRAEFVDDDEQRARMLNDLEEMETMISATLAFARDNATSEPRTRLDLAALVQGLLDDLTDLGAECSYCGPQSLVIEARPLALKRAFANLADNAVKYGGRAMVTLVEAGDEIHLAIDDDGPGIPEADTERVFAPFVRLEASRSRDTGGTGLGLAVARAAVRAHGGDICLANRPEGGLRVTVVLPR